MVYLDSWAMLTRIIQLSALMAASLSAQSVLSTKAGLVSDGGEVYMDDRRVEISPSGIVMVNENAVLRTGAGKAEVLLGPCAAIWIDENSSFRLISNDIIDTRIEWLTGSAVVGAGAFQGGAQITVQLRAVSVLVADSGRNGALIPTGSGARLRRKWGAVSTGSGALCGPRS